MRTELILATTAAAAAASAASAAYIDVVNAADPVGFYQLDETGGTSTASNSASASGANTVAEDGIYSNFGDLSAAQGQPGIPAGGSAVQFGGSNDVVSFGTSYDGLSAGTESFTLEAWVNLGDIDLADLSTGFAVSFFREGQSNRYRTIGVSGTTGQAILQQNDNGSDPEVTGGADLTDGGWHHLVGVFTNDGTSLEDQLYVDGVSVGGVNGRSVSSGIDTIIIGGRYASNGSGSSVNGEFDGLIDNVGIYDYSLSDSQILANYNAGIVIPEPASLAGLGLLGLVGLRRRR